ncbi:DUF1223 domain-containing protein [Pararhizobium gei]|uniref:DUF1223 domain-containing protein n=1 Tax=Pararhizobium gei TaxID=1395951 RepID=UPI0023D9D3C0|nr:thioredoxin family protein [Rhizobium gei]
MSLPSATRRVLLAIGFCLSALPAVAGEPAGVVELFTSQGCSSCPPADAALKKLIDDGKVVALSYHVDYWNYLGWADTLATKDNTARQYAYARMLGRSGVYTPQAILNGRSHINGADLDGINRKLTEMSTNGKGLAVPVQASVKNDEIEIKVGAGSGKANLLVIYFNREQMVDVKTGENSGKTISYWHAVRDIQTVGMWDGKPARFVLPASVLQEGENGGCAVLLQKMKNNETPGAILGATTIMGENKAN